MKVITLTLNPAIDLHLTTDRLTVGSDNKCSFVRRDSGGKGVNLSRALWVNGVPSLCYMLLGRENYGEFLAPLDSLGMQTAYRLVDGRIRENINIHHGVTETVIATDGPIPSAAELDLVAKELLSVSEKGDILAFSGRISDGTDKERVLDILCRLRDKGVRLALDSKSLSGDDIHRLRPEVIKPNYEEALELLGIDMEDVDNRAPTGLAYRLYREYFCDVLLTLGSGGAALASCEGVYYAMGRVDARRVLSTVGAGDSALAGFVAGLLQGKEHRDALALSVAYGTAACLREGTLPPDPEDVKRILDTVSVREIM